MKRLLCMLLAAALLLGLGGCSIFDRSVYELTDYSAETEEGSDDGVGYISDYAALRRAIVWLVSEHQESAELQFQNYDGNISRDLSQACWEVKSSTPLGAFAVDYTSFDLSRIVSFYQADIYITYKRSAEQMLELEQLGGLSSFLRRLDEALSGGERYLVLQMTAASLTPELVKEYIRRAYYADALASPVLPEAEVSLYPDSGVERIVEITLDYGLSDEELTAQREALTSACQSLAATLTDDTDAASGEPADIASGETDGTADRLAAAVQALGAACQYDANGGSGAYDALVTGRANSEGLAMAFQALCSSLGLDCQVVSGRLDNEPHFWNIVSFGGASYHLDLTEPDSRFLLGDDGMWGRYWWDTAAYPACAADYSYTALAGDAASPEPTGVPSGVTLPE